MWDKYAFKPGDRVARADGAWFEVLSAADAGDRLRVRRAGVGADATLAGPVDELAVDDVISVSPAPPGPGWGDRVTVVVHHVPESEAGEAGYGAITMGGVPLGVSVEASDEEFAPEALDRLLGALAAFGYSGTVQVEDATYVGGIQRYELEVP